MLFIVPWIMSIASPARPKERRDQQDGRDERDGRRGLTSDEERFLNSIQLIPFIPSSSPDPQTRDEPWDNHVMCK